MFNKWSKLSWPSRSGYISVLLHNTCSFRLSIPFETAKTVWDYRDRYRLSGRWRLWRPLQTVKTVSDFLGSCKLSPQFKHECVTLCQKGVTWCQEGVTGCHKGVIWCQEGFHRASKVSHGVKKVLYGARKVLSGARKVSHGQWRHKRLLLVSCSASVVVRQ